MDPAAYVRTLSDLASRREPFAVAAVTKTEGSTLGKPGFKIIVARDGRVLYGTLGGGCPDGPIVAVAQQTIQTGAPRVVRVHLVDATQAVGGTVASQDPDEIYVETNCGGTMEIYVEPYLPPHRLVLVANGGRDEMEDDLVHFAKRLGYEVIVFDPLPALKEKPDRLIANADAELAAFPFDERDAVVVLTKGERDVAVLEALSKARAGYVGMLSSRTRTRTNFEELRRRGVPVPFLESIHTPIGLDLGGHAPAEIALAILAEITASRNGRTFERKP